MSLSLKSTVSIVMTGWSGVGKTKQAANVFNAVLPAWAQAFASKPDDVPTRAFPFRPMLVISCETSTAGTMGQILASRDCTHVTVDNLAEFQQALALLDDGHNAQRDDEGNVITRGTAFRSVFFDGWTAFTEGSKSDARNLAVEEDGKKTLDGKAKQNDERIMSKAGAAEARSALRAWSGAGARHEGLLMLSTAHACEKWMPKPGAKQGERVQVGERLDLPPKPCLWLMNGANMILYFGRILADAGTITKAESLDALGDINRADVAPSYFALTAPIKVQEYLYECVKWQDNVFRPIDPKKPQPHDVQVVWRNPDLGAALLESPLLIPPPAPKAAAPKQSAATTPAA
jgi:hypothetical protein